MNLTHVSGIPTPQPGEINFYVSAAGTASVRRSDGSVISVAPVNLSGLVDLTGPWVSGQLPVLTGSSFVGGSAGGAGAALTVYSSGEVWVTSLLASGAIPNGGTAATIVFSGISQSYDHLFIRGMARANAAATSVVLVNYYLNGDATATNYISRRENADGGTGFTSSPTAQNDASVGLVQGSTYLPNSTTAPYLGPIDTIFPDYSKAGHRKFFYTNGFIPYVYDATPTAGGGYGWAQWENTSGPAINMIEVRVVNAVTTFASGTALYLYGQKKIWVITSGLYGTAPIINGRFA